MKELLHFVDNGMSIDRTIVEIDEQLQAWNSALFKIDAQLEGALEKVDVSLAQFERAVQTVQGDAANIRDQIVDTASKVRFPILFYALFPRYSCERSEISQPHK